MAQTRIALITCTGAWPRDDDAPLLVQALADQEILAEPAIWDSPEVDWSSYSAAVLRSPWDYTERPSEFLAALEKIQLSTKVLNPLAILRWNFDKHYLADLAQAGLSVVPTEFVSDLSSFEEQAFPSEGRFVVKPTISSGSRNTAQYGQSERAEARAHLEQLLEAGHQVMVQPYIDSVEDVGETGMVFFLDEFSHGFRKGALLTEGTAPVAGLYAPEAITPREPSPAQLELAHRALQITRERCGTDSLLYARVDVLEDSDGQPQLLELELTEPSYFLRTDAASPARAAAAYARALA